MPSFDKETLDRWREQNIQDYLSSNTPLNNLQRNILLEELEVSNDFLSSVKEQIKFHRAYKKRLEKRLSKP